MTNKNPSEWRVSPTSVIGERTLYQVCRLRDKDEADHSGNRETRGGYYDSLRDAERLARTLNEEEGRA